MDILNLFHRRPKSLDALSELRAELRGFAHDGLTTLRADLEADRVQRGTWEGCVLSYRRGAAGSVDCDRRGRRGNIFTRVWDAECFSPAEVIAAIDAELERRAREAGRARTRVTPDPVEDPVEEPALFI